MSTTVAWMSGADIAGRSCHPGRRRRTSVRVMETLAALPRMAVARIAGPVDDVSASERTSAAAGAAAAAANLRGEHDLAREVDALVARLFREEGASLVRLARFFVDDRTAAEDLVQEAFIRFARAAHRIREAGSAPAYLRSIVLNLARDHNRRGLVSLRHHLPEDEPDPAASAEDTLVAEEGRAEVLAALRALAARQRDALVLRYWLELPLDEIAETMGVSRNSVKTHLRRGLEHLERRLGGTT